jgi:hypothetical protein
MVEWSVMYWYPLRRIVWCGLLANIYLPHFSYLSQIIDLLFIPAISNLCSMYCSCDPLNLWGPSQDYWKAKKKSTIDVSRLFVWIWFTYVSSFPRRFFLFGYHGILVEFLIKNNSQSQIQMYYCPSKCWYACQLLMFAQSSKLAHDYKILATYKLFFQLTTN